MKVKKIVALAAAAALATSVLASCGTANRKSYEKDGKKIYTYYLNMYTQDSVEYAEGQDTNFANLIRDKFNVELNYDRIPRGDWETKTNLSYATGNEAEITTGGKEPQYKKWASEGYLDPIPEEAYTGDDCLLKDWKALWSEEEFKKVLSLAKSSDGKLYYLPTLRQEKAQMCWDYRKDIFDSLGITEFPSTIDELYDVCAKIKAAYPDKIIISCNGLGTTSPGSAITGFCQAYWMPELIMTQHSYVDPVTNEYVPYALTTDNAREMYKTIKKFNDAGFIDRELFSVDKDTFSSRLAQDNCFITYNYVYNINDFNKKTKGTDADKVTDWQWSDTMITAFPEKGTIYKRDPLYSNWGPAFSEGISEDMDRYNAILTMFNWFATEEGQLYNTYGVKESDPDYMQKGIAEGNYSYTMTDGKPKFNEGWYDESNSKTDKKKDKTLSHEYGSLGSQFKKEQHMFDDIRGKEVEALYEAFNAKDKYYYFEQVPMRYTEDEEQKYSDLEIALNAKRDEYIQRFFSGDVDPTKDSDWQMYINDMNKVGLQEFIELQTRVYERTKAEVEKEEAELAAKEGETTDAASAETAAAAQ